MALGLAALILDVSVETMAFQAYLEAVRMKPWSDELAEDLGKAKAQMERAWLERGARLPAAA